MRNFKYLFEVIFVIAAVLATTLIYGPIVNRLLFLVILLEKIFSTRVNNNLNCIKI